MSEDPLASVVKGAILAGAEWTEAKVKSVAVQFLKGDLRLVEDVDTMKIVEAQRKSPELDLFTKYVDDATLIFLFKMGLTLRKLEYDVPKRNALRTMIAEQFDPIGLHIAEFCQNNFFSKYLDTIMSRAKDKKALKQEIADFFLNIEKTVSFIKETDNVDKKAKEIVTRIQSNLPKTYIIFSSVSAIVKCRKIKRLVMAEISSYTADLYSTDSKEVYFLNKVD